MSAVSVVFAAAGFLLLCAGLIGLAWWIVLGLAWWIVRGRM